MYVLDTDHLSLLGKRANLFSQRLQSRLAQIPPEQQVTTIISFEEQTRGWLALMAQSSSLAHQVEVYRRLHELLNRYTQTTVLDFDEAAAAQFERLQKLRLRVGTMDLKIAAIALTHNATVLTRNLRDFTRVPGLSVEDWTR